MKKDRSHLFLFAGLSVLAILSRFLPHPPNFTPIGALALLAAREIRHPFMAMGLTIFLMLVSDIFLGFSNTSFFVYLSFLLVGLTSWTLFSRGFSWMRWGLAPLLSSTLFFIVSNFGVWVTGGLYPLTFDGLLTCYTMAIPFYHLSLLGDLFYWSLLSGSFYLVSVKFPVSTVRSNA